MRLARLAGIAWLTGIGLSGAVGCGNQGHAQSSSTASPANGVDPVVGPSRGAIPLIVDSIDETKRTLLPGNTRPEVRPEFDRGPVDDSLPLNGIQLQLRRSPEHEQVAEALANELQRAGSPQFHQWLSADQYAQQFGVAQEDIVKISAWLGAHGFTVHPPSPSRMTINFSGTAGQVREAFGTEIHALEVKGVRHIANVRDPQIPASLAPAVEGIVSLHDFRPHAMLSRRPQYTIPPAAMPFYAVAPADLATIYRFNPLFSAGITGEGQTIAVVEDSDLYNPEDWKTFRKTFGLDAYKGASLETVHPGGCADPGLDPSGDDIESAVDVEWASAAAPSADILLASCANTTTVFGGLIAVQNLLNRHDVPSMISMSYGECEAENGAAANAAYKAAYQQAVLEGVSVFVAAGDNGGAICDNGPTGPAQYGMEVNAFASTVYDLAVGGTDFGDYYSGTTAKYWSPTNGPKDRSVLTYVPEITWNDTCASTLISNYFGFTVPDSFCATLLPGDPLLLPYAGGGGPSNCAVGNSASGIANSMCRGWKKPSWQTVLGNPSDGVRDLPDVSMFAADGVWDHAYVFCNSDPSLGAPCVGAPSGWSLNGGTSFSSPILAGVQAMVNQVWGGPQGNPAPVYYGLARREYGKQGRAECQTFADGGPASTCTYYDIAVGDTAVACTGPNNCYAPAADAGAAGVLSVSDVSYEPAFASSVGWDFATGIGTVNVANLVLDPAWAEGSSP